MVLRNQQAYLSYTPFVNYGVSHKIQVHVIIANISFELGYKIIVTNEIKIETISNLLSYRNNWYPENESSTLLLNFC